MSKCIGITGATSGLGRRLLELLLDRGYKLRCLVRNPESLPPDFPREVVLHPGDMRSYESLTSFVQGLDLCIHLAARVSAATRAEFFAVNSAGTENLCKAIIRENRTCRLIHCSTISTLKVKPLRFWTFTYYTLSKYAAEKTVLDYGHREGLKYTIVYPGVIFGHYDRHVIPGLIKGLALGKMVLLRGGEQRAHLIYVDDLCELFIKVCENPATRGKRYVSVKGLKIGVHDLIRQVAAECGYRVSNKVYPAWPFKLLANLQALYYRLLKPGRHPFFTRSLVNVLCRGIAHYAATLDDPLEELGWEQQTSREAVILQVRQALEDYRKAAALSRGEALDLKAVKQR